MFAEYLSPLKSGGLAVGKVSFCVQGKVSFYVARLMGYMGRVQYTIVYLLYWYGLYSSEYLQYRIIDTHGHAMAMHTAHTKISVQLQPSYVSCRPECSL